jgi:hypothetical protein
MTCVAGAGNCGVTASRTARSVRAPAYRRGRSACGCGTSRDLRTSIRRLADEPRRRLAALRKRSIELNERRARLRAETVASAQAQVGSVSERDLLVLGVALYWAEGAKRKPWAPSDRITFVNSDPSIVRTWLRWLDLVGVSRERCRFRLQIHERADVAAAERFWAETVGVTVDRLMRTTLKRHRPVTPRRNTAPG